jgi:hypothetical protein
MRFAGHDLHLLSDLFLEIENGLPSMPASHRVALADIIEAVAPFHPLGVASLVGALRRDHSLDETLDGLFGPRVMGQGDVLLSLAWPLFHAAMGAGTPEECEAVLRELCDLAEAEAQLAPTLPRGLPNDGKRAAALIKRVIEGGPQFSSDFDEASRKLCAELIKALIETPPTPAQVALLTALVESVLDLERRQIWNDDRSFGWRTIKIVPGTPAWATREDVLQRVKAALAANSTPIESRVQLWHVVSRAGKDKALEVLRWTHDVLTTRSPNIQELIAARELWDWHRRYETDAELKAAADALEALYTHNELAKEFEPLLPDIENFREIDGHSSAKAADLARASSPTELSAFLDRAEAFGGSDQSLLKLGRVAWSLGEHADANEVIQQFIQVSLKPTSIDPRAEFVVAVVVSWVAAVRRAARERSHVLVRDLLDKCGSDERRAHLLERLYGRVPKLNDSGEFSAEERELLCSSRHLFTNTQRDVAFVAALGLTAVKDWPTLQPLLENVVQAVPAGCLSQSIRALVSAIYWAAAKGTGGVAAVAGASAT